MDQRPIATKAEKEGHWSANPDWWVAGFTGALFVATAGLWIFTALLWRTTKKAVADSNKGIKIADQTLEHARKASEHELRAYVSANPFFIVAFDATMAAGAKVSLKNTGLTPARMLRHRIQIELLSFPFQAATQLPELASQPSAPVVLFPGGELQGSGTATRLFTPQEIVSIKDATLAICIYGEVTYIDIFDEPRWTRFCSYVDADRATLSKLTSAYIPDDLKVSFSVAPMGNDAS